MGIPTERGAKECKTYSYGAGIASAAIGLGFLIVSFYTSEEFLSDDVEWHLWSTSLPLIIPNFIMKTIWWVLLAVAFFSLFTSFLPNAEIIISDNDIAVQSPLTRRFMSMHFDQITKLTVINKSIFLSNRNNRNLTIISLYVSRRDYKEITELLFQRIGGLKA